jgi:hypothetical protein
MKLSEIKRKIYVDLDGVIVACTKSAADFNNISKEKFIDSGYDNKYWKNFIKNSDMYQEFANMGWESNGKKLLKFFNDRNLSYTFLTRPIKEPYTKHCINGKLSWLMRAGLDEVSVIFERHKEKYAGNGNILIDDDSRNIDEWNAAGGVGILYHNDKYHSIIKKLEHIFKAS